MSVLKARFPRAPASRARWLFAAQMAICAGLLVDTPAFAASLTGPISGWEVGTEPSWVSMYEYVPDNLAPNPPILVVVHYCSGNAAGVFGQAQGGGMVAAADQYGFIMVLPQTVQNCWDVATTPSLTHDGGGDTGAIVHQVQFEISRYNANADRVYVTGTSSGAMVTQALLAVYPDVFKGGSEFAGVPAGCWSVNDPDGQWSSPCAGGQVTHTAAEWGDMARAMYPGYSGFRPRIQLWHGEADSILSFTNQTEAIKQWTNVLGLSSDPTSTMSVTIDGGQYTRQQWQDACGITVLDAWTQSQGPHGTDANMNAQYSIPFLALDQVGPTDPQTVGCTDASGGTGGSPGSGGDTGNPGSGGSSAGGADLGSGGTTSGAVGTGSGGSAATTGASGGGTGGPDTAGSSGGTGATGLGGNQGPGPNPTGGVDDSGASVPSRPGCSCDLARAPRGLPAFAWATILAVAWGRRRRRR